MCFYIESIVYDRIGCLVPNDIANQNDLRICGILVQYQLIWVLEFNFHFTSSFFFCWNFNDFSRDTQAKLCDTIFTVTLCVYYHSAFFTLFFEFGIFNTWVKNLWTETCSYIAKTIFQQFPWALFSFLCC